MKRILSGLIVVFVLGLLAHVAAAQQLAPAATLTPVTLPSTMRTSVDADLLMHGSARRFWIARVVPAGQALPGSTGEAATDSGPQTEVYIRQDGGANWFRLSVVPGRVVGLAHRADQLAMLFADGGWMLISPEDGTVTGARLPGDVPMVYIANDDHTLWAIGDVPGGLGGAIALIAAEASSTEPTTYPTTDPTKPREHALPTSRSLTTLPATNRSSRPVLFESVDGIWTPRAELPLGVSPAQDAAFTLSVFNRVPYLAYLTSPSAVQVDALREGNWVDIATLDSGSPILNGVLLAGTPSPVLWLGHAKPSADEIYFLAGPAKTPVTDRSSAPSATTQPRAILLSSVDAPPGERWVDFAVGNIHRLWIDRSAGTAKPARIMDQTFDPQSGAAVGGTVALSLQNVSEGNDVSRQVSYLLWMALLFAVITSMRWRRDIPGVSIPLDNIALASFGSRFWAGLIDLVPVLVALLFLAREMTPLAHEIVVLIGVLIYLAHTSLTETLAGRSVGKMCLGLTVVALDGQPASRGALLLRNVLRVVDVLFIFPLLSVLRTPLRQRTGDVAAMTLVVHKRGVEPVGPKA